MALTAAAYFTHPWFDKPSMKRRRSSSSEDDSIDLSPSSAGSKRRRVTALERGLSNLSLQHLQPTSPAVVTTSHPVSVSPHSPHYSTILPTPSNSDITAMEVDCFDSSSMLPFIQPDSVEEPPSPPDIRMKGSSWYEPEPDRESSSVSFQSHQDSKTRRFTGIVVTDLDSSDDEEESEPSHPVISPALLEHIRKRERSTSIPELLPPNQQALVLYRPLNIKSSPAVDDEQKVDVVESSIPEVDMMDIEM